MIIFDIKLFQEPLWAYQKSPSDHIKGFHEPTSTSRDTKAFTSKAQPAYDNPGPPIYPFIDETPTDPDRNYFAYHEHSGRPMSGQCKFKYHTIFKNKTKTMLKIKYKAKKSNIFF